MSFPQYPTYKDSSVEWLGEVPGHWDVKRLRRTISVPLSNGIFKKKEEFGSGTLLVNVFDIYREDFKVNFDSLERVKCDDNELSNYEVLPEDLFFVRSSLKLEGIAVVAMADSWSEAVIFECHLIRARPNRKVLSGRFASYVLNSTVYRSTMIAKAKITTMTTIDQEAILSTYLPVPPLPEQSQIAAFLDRETAKIDALVAEQRRLMELLKEKRQAVISHAVTRGLNPNAPMKPSGIEWLGDVPEHWAVLPIKRIVSVPITDGPHETPNFIDEGVPFVSAEAVSSGVINFSKVRACISEEDNARYSLKYAPKLHDIYMVKSGATTGVTAMVEDRTDFNIWSPLAAIRCNDGSVPHFVLNFMRSKNFQEAVTLNWSFGTQQNIGMGVIENLACTVPPVAEQIAIAEMLKSESAKFDTLTAEAQRAIDLLQERRTALISAAVAGQIDVRTLSEVS
jgi:type I restriction enzyme S subunit